MHSSEKRNKCPYYEEKKLSRIDFDFCLWTTIRVIAEHDFRIIFDKFWRLHIYVCSTAEVNKNQWHCSY